MTSRPFTVDMVAQRWGCSSQAVRNMIGFLVAAKGMTRDDAYMLVSTAGDVEVTELVEKRPAFRGLKPIDAVAHQPADIERFLAGFGNRKPERHHDLGWN